MFSAADCSPSGFPCIILLYLSCGIYPALVIKSTFYILNSTSLLFAILSSGRWPECPWQNDTRKPGWRAVGREAANNEPVKNIQRRRHYRRVSRWRHTDKNLHACAGRRRKRPAAHKMQCKSGHILMCKKCIPLNFQMLFFSQCGGRMLRIFTVNSCSWNIWSLVCVVFKK